MNENIVAKLRRSGHKVRVKHYRKVVNQEGDPIADFNIPNQLISPKGGKTEVEVRMPDGKEFFGVALCSDEDSYNRRLGVKIAVARALKQANEFLEFAKTLEPQVV